MLYYQPFLGGQECLYMLYWPVGALEPALKERNSEQEVKSVEQGGILQASEEGDERIILTREDLEIEGHQTVKKPWSKEEDRLLMKLCNNEEAKFSDIAMRIPGRNAKMCYSRFRRLSHQTRQGWKPEEDQRLLQLVSQHGENQWKVLSTFFEGRTHKQLKQHFVNYLRPGLEKGEWKVEQELQLIRLINIHGKNWNIIEQGLPGRSRNQIKNRFFGRVTRLNRKKMEVLGLSQP